VLRVPDAGVITRYLICIAIPPSSDISSHCNPNVITSSAGGTTTGIQIHANPTPFVL
jgi:hypothetical protein